MRTFSPAVKQLVNHIFGLLKLLTDGNLTFLVIAVEYANLLLEKYPIYFALGCSEPGKALHWLFQEQTGVSNSGKLVSRLSRLLEAVEQNSKPNIAYSYLFSVGKHPITPVLDLISHVIDQRLAEFPTFPEDPAEITTFPVEPRGERHTQSTSYTRLSVEVSLELLKVYPKFILWRPACFQRFLDCVILADKQEPVSQPLRFKTISDIVCTAYYKALQCVDTTSTFFGKGDNDLYAKGLEDAKSFLAQAPKSDHPIFYRSVACHLSLFLGYLSVKRDETDLTYSWRPEFVAMLDLFGNDEEGSLRKLAWVVDITTPVFASPYCSLAK